MVVPGGAGSLGSGGASSASVSVFWGSPRPTTLAEGPG